MSTLTAVALGGNFMTAATWSPAQIPTAADDCLLISTSGPVTIDSGAVCRSLNLTGYLNVVTHTAAVTLTIGDATAGLGNVALEFPTSGWTYTLGNTTTSAITFVSTSATVQTVNFGGQATGSVTFNAGSGGSWQYTGAQTGAGTLTLTQGTLDLNGQAVTINSFNSSNALTRSLTLGAATITLNAGTTIWTMTNTSGLVFSGGSVTILTSTSASTQTFHGGGLTYGALTLSGNNPTLNGANTFTTLTRVGNNVKTNTLTLGASQVVTGTLTLTGNSTTNRLLITSDTLGTPYTLTAATVAASRVDFRDIAGAGGGDWNLSAITGLSGDCGGNNGMTLTTAATQTSTGTASFTWSTHGWTSRVPLPQDDVVINNAFIAGRTVTLDMPRAGKSITWTGATGTPAWAVTTATTVYGSITKIAAMTQSGTTNVTLEGRGAFLFTNAGITWTNPLIIACVNGSVTLADAILSTSTFTHTNGTWIDAGFASTFTTATSTSGLTRTLTRTGVLTVTGTGAVVTVTTTGLTHTGTGATLTVSDTSVTSKTVAGGGLTTLGTLSITGSGSGSVDITGSNTFENMTIGAPKTVRFTAGTTTTLTGAFTATGTSGNVITISSITAATHTLSKASGIVRADWLSLTNSIATGGALWYAGPNSTSVSGNSGWIFNTVGIQEARGWWKANAISFGARTITLTPGRVVWWAPGAAVTRSMTLTPGRIFWAAEAATITRLFDLTPGRIVWQAPALLIPRSLIVTPGYLVWVAPAQGRPHTVDVTPGRVAWIAQGVEGIGQRSRAAPPLIVLVRQVGEAWVVEVP